MAFVNPIRRYSEKKLIGYTREQLFDVVAAVENYHLFVPGCRRSEVTHREETLIKARLEIGRPPLLESYTSRVCLERPKLIKASCVEGVLFKHMDTRWQFDLPPSPYPKEQSCLVNFQVAFEFKSFLVANLASTIFDEIARMNISAFMKRAEKLYGPAYRFDQIKYKHH